MKREIILSLVLHVVLITAAFISTPFSMDKPFDYGDVIKIKAVSFPEVVEAPAPLEPVSIPEPVAEEVIDIPIDDPTSVDKPKPIDKPKEEKPKEEKPKPEPQNNPRKSDKPAQQGGDEDNKEIDTKATSQGSPFAGATIDNASFNYPYWFTQAFNKIASNFRRTVSIDAPVICIVSFRVLKSGRVLDLEIKKSSGYEAVDRDCLAAIERSAPFPPLPKDFREEIIGITLPIKY